MPKKKKAADLPKDPSRRKRLEAYLKKLRKENRNG